jgi:phosphonate transport system permease protein
MSTKIKPALLDSLSLGFLIIGALVLFLQPTQEALLQLGRVSLIALGCLLIATALTFGLYRRGSQTLGKIVFASVSESIAQRSLPWYSTFWGWQLLIVFIAMFYAAFEVTEFSFFELTSPQGLAGARRIFSSLATPNFDILPQAILAIIETIFIAFMATVLAVPVAFVLSFFCAKNLMSSNPMTLVLYGLLRTVLNLIRSIEPLVWAIVFSVWVGIGPFAGMLALMLHSAASLAKNYSELTESIEEGPIEAIQATGAKPLQMVWFAVVPQIILPYTAFTIYRWDINVRMATIIGLVGGGGIGTMLIQYQGQALWNEVGCLVLVIAIVVWLMDNASAYLREALK